MTASMLRSPVAPGPTPVRLALAGLLLLAACGDKEAAPGTDPKLFVVKRGDLPITVTENAELQAQRETIIRSEIEGQASIIWIVPEGTQAAVGDKLVELDVSDLVEKRATQAINVTEAEALWQQSQEDHRILAKDLTTKRRTAESNLTIAQMELEKFLGRKSNRGSGTEGKNAEMVKRLADLINSEPSSTPGTADASGPRAADPQSAEIVAQVDPRNFTGLIDKVHELMNGDSIAEPSLDHDMGDMSNQVLQQVDQIRLAIADLKVKEDTYLHSKKLAAKQFITRNELDRDKLAWQSQVSKVTLSWNDLDLLINYTLAKQRIKLRQDVDNAQLELERVLASNTAAEFKAKCDEDSKREKFKLAKERLDNLDRQIKTAVMTAPTPGVVVYAKIDRGRSGEAVREGVQVRERQELIVLPDTTKMRAVVKVQEAQVEKLRKGQPAYVRPEASPGDVFTGRVFSVAPVADSNSQYMTSDRKVYTTVVELDGDNLDARLRSRMAASVTIQVDTITNVLKVPLQAVRRDRSVHYVWKLTGSDAVPVVVQTGKHNSDHVIITEGLAEGDTVLLAPPADAQEPKFQQPDLPTPAPQQDSGAAADGGKPGSGKKDGSKAEGSKADGGKTDGGKTDGGKTDGQGRTSGHGPGGPRKKLTEMSPEELQTFKESGLAMYDGMLDRFRAGMTEEQVQQFESKLQNLRRLVEANKLEEAETVRASLQSVMRGSRGGGANGGGRGNGGGDAGAGNPGGGPPGGNAPGGSGGGDR
jgi:RND family efflux transporter MFP subunit